MLALTRTIHPKNCSAIGCTILVFDRDEEAVNLIKSLGAEGNIKIPHKEEINITESIVELDLIESDICAIFLSEEFDSDGLTGIDIATKFHSAKSNTPIFMRLTGDRTLNDLPMAQRQLITGCYTTNRPEQLKKITESFLYGFYFPNHLVQIFIEAGLYTLNCTIENCEIKSSVPFLVYDYTLAAEFTSILPMQLPFGNGALTFSIKENDALILIKNDHTALNKDQTSTDHCNQFISEITNQFWGKVRRMCQAVYGSEQHRAPVTIPIIVNHQQKYISFGNHTPQLCFRYLLIRDHLIPEAISVEFKIIFNTILRPKDFYELLPRNPPAPEDDHYESFP
jgi:hypothetical protein